MLGGEGAYKRLFLGAVSYNFTHKCLVGFDSWEKLIWDIVALF